MAEIKGNKVSLETFLKWEKPEIAYEEEKIDGKRFVVKIWCRLCAKHSVVLRRESSSKGSIKKSMEAFIMGTKCVTKHQVDRHLSGDLHKISIREEGKVPQNERIVPVPTQRQPRIETAIETSAAECYTRMMKTAYELALNPSLPLRTFNLLISCQRKNGVKLIKGRDDSRAAKEFMHSIATAVTSKCEDLINKSSFMSLLSDGSQARKTQEDKELLLTRIVRHGSPVYLLINLLNMADYGGTDAESIKDAMDSVFDETDGSIKLPAEDYRRKLISATADGASVNMGAYRGVLTRLEESRDWLIKIHCVNHRIELAAKKVVNESVYSEVEKLYLTIYFFLQNSGRFKSECKKLAEALDIDYKELPKIHGTRFLGHKRLGITNLLANWPIFKGACENAVSVQGTRRYNALTKVKIAGMLNQFRDYRLLMLTATYLDLLDRATPISKIFEMEVTLPCDIAVSVKRTVQELQDLADEAGTPEENLDSHIAKYVNLLEDEDAKKFIELEYIKRGEARKKPDNRGKKNVKLSDLKNANEATVLAASRQKETVALEWIRVLRERFADFENDEIYCDMQWVDSSSWTDNPTYGENQILNLAAHFDSPLNFAGFDVSKVLKEWKSCKRLIRAKFANTEVTNIDIWRYIIMSKQKPDFPNLCLLLELVFTISVSNSTVERSFNILTMMMTDRRLNLTHDILLDVMLIKCNNKNWTELEKNSIIDHAVKIYTGKRRSQQIDDPTKTDDSTQKRKIDDVFLVDDQEEDDSDEDIDFEDIVL